MSLSEDNAEILQRQIEKYVDLCEKSVFSESSYPDNRIIMERYLLYVYFVLSLFLSFEICLQYIS